MFADYVARILRESWSKGSQRVERPSPTDGDRDEAIRGVSAKLQQLAEEIATLNGLNPPLTHHNFLEAQNFCRNVADIPPSKWFYDEFCAAGGADNAASHFRPNGDIRNGVGHKVRGIQFVEGSVLVRQRKPNDPKGPPLPIGMPGGGTINILNSAGGTIGPFSIGRAVGTITAAVNAANSITLGRGTVAVQKCTKRVTSFLESAVAYNPFQFEIPSDTWVLMGRYWDVAEQADIYLVVSGLGVFRPSSYWTATLNDGASNQEFTVAGGEAAVKFDEVYSSQGGEWSFNASTYEATCQVSGIYQMESMLQTILAGATTLDPPNADAQFVYDIRRSRGGGAFTNAWTQPTAFTMTYARWTDGTTDYQPVIQTLCSTSPQTVLAGDKFKWYGRMRYGHSSDRVGVQKSDIAGREVGTSWVIKRLS